MYKVEWLVTKTTITITVILVPPGGGGGRNKVVPAVSVDTFRGGRKGDPQH